MSQRGTARLSKAAPSAPTDWEDQYHRLQSQHGELKGIYNEMEEHNRKLQSKIRRIEADFLALGGGGTAPSGPREREDEQLVAKLYQENSKLKSQNAGLKEKYKNAVELLDKKKRENAMLNKKVKDMKPTAGSSIGKSTHALQEIDIRAGPTTKNASRPLSAPKASAESLPAVDNSNLLEVARKYKTRLVAAEEILEQLRAENQRLKVSGGGKLPTPKGVNNGDINDENARDANWRLQQLQTQYDFLVSKTSSQSQVYKQMETQIEDSSSKVRDLRRALEELRHEKEAADIKADRADELEQVTSELRRANRSLEDKIARLCEAPFISDAFGQHESRLHFEDVAKEREEYLAKVNHLQEAVRTHFSALTSLKQHAAQLREEKEEAERKAEDMKLKMQEMEAGSSVIQDKLRLYSGDDGIDIESLERALTLVKRRGEAVGKLQFLEDVDGEDSLTVPIIKRKLEEVQVMNLKLTEEVERFESMLKLQSGINRDLHKELEVLIHKRDSDKKIHAKRADEFETLASKRLEKISSLEAQVRQLVYDVSKRGFGKGGNGGKIISKPGLGSGVDLDDASNFETSMNTNDTGNALLNELIDEGHGELNPDANLIEVWVKGANLMPNTVATGSSSFMVVDFFDYESQTTSLLTGTKPAWDFAASYKVVVDDFLLRYLATDVITIELNAANQGDFSMLARCTIPLSALLKSKPWIQLVNYPMISVRTGEILAYVNLEVRLALPVGELYRLFLERHPSEKKFIKERASQLQLEAASAADKAQQAGTDIAAAKEDESRLYNDLEVAIIKAEGLPLSTNGKAPTAYVHFQFLGHPDKFTNPVPAQQSPGFNERFTFAMITNDQQLRLLRRSKLQLTLIDMNGEEASDGEGLIGEVSIGLQELAEGSSFQDTFSVKDSQGNKVADIVIGMRWKHTFREQRDLGPRALSAVEVETLISAFSASNVNEGVVDYRAFCRFVDPPVEIRRCIDRLRNYAQRIGDSEGRAARDVFEVLFSESGGVGVIDSETFVSRMEPTNIDVLPADFVRLFQFIDMDEDNAVTLDQVLAVLNLDEVVAVPHSLNDKLRDRARDLQARGISTLTLFEQADQWGANGLVTRLEFKGVVKKMGFQLVDEAEADELMHAQFTTLAGNGNRGPQKVENATDILNDTINSNEDALIEAEADLAPGGARGAISGRFASEEAKQQRQIFDERSKEAMQQREQALHMAQDEAMQAAKSPKISGTMQGKNILNNNKGGKHHVGAETRPQTSEEVDSDPFKGDNHSSGVTKNGNRDVPYDARDAAQLDDLATKLQSTVRGFNSRKDEPDAPTSGAAVPVLDGIASQNSQNQNNPNTSVPDIIQAEGAVRESLRKLRGVAPEPNVLAGFEKVDTKRNGHVNRAQFAHVMKQFSTIALHGAQLRAVMDFFDASSSRDGSKIRYESFAQLVRYREPEALPAVSRLSKVVLGPDAAVTMRAYDSSGSGQIKRADMMRAMSSLGYDHVGGAAMLSMLELFETKQDGQVNYGNFVEMVRESPLSASLDQAAHKVFELVTNSQVSSAAAVDEVKAREWFAKIDTGMRGKFTSQQLSTFLDSYDIRAPKEVYPALLGQMDSQGRGEVHMSDFVAWLRNLPHAQRNAAAMYSTPAISEIQRKASSFLVAVAKSASAGAASPSLDEISGSYAVYDWRKPQTGSVDAPLFVSATKRAGFPFTTGEMRTLCAEFIDTYGRIKYRKFLEWATPLSGSAALAAAGGLNQDQNDNSNTLTKGHSPASLIRFLEKKMQEGADLLSIFGRYDRAGAGRITADEFCAAFGELGVSTVSHKDALELADRYNAAVSNFVMYRRIVTDLLRHVDDVTGAASIDVVDTVRAALQRSKVEVRRLRDLFEYYDRKNTGRVAEDDLGTIFEEARVRLKRQELDAIGDKFCISGGSQGRGSITYVPLLIALESRMDESPTGMSSAAVGEELGAKMRGFLEQMMERGKDFRSEFDRLDENTIGSVTQTAFREVLMDRLRGPFGTRELETMEKVYRDTEDPRRVSFVRMLKDLHPRFFSAGRSTTSGVEDSNDVAEMLRQKIRRRCDYMQAGELKRPYRHFARRRDSSGVSLDDLALGIRELGMRVASDQVKEVFEMINLGGNGGEFSYTDFCVFVKDPFHADVVWKLRRLLSKARISEAEVTSALKEQDSNRSGLITLSQFERALSYCKIELSPSDVARLLHRFDSEENSRVDVDSFARFLRGQPAAAGASTLGATSNGDENSAETQAWSAVRRRALDRLEAGFTPGEVFALFDQDNKGNVDLQGLSSGAREIGCTLTRPEARAIMRRMTLLAGGPVDKNTFFEAFQIDLKTDYRISSSHTRTGDDRRDDRSGRDRDRRSSSPRGDTSGGGGGDMDGVYDSLRDRLERHRDIRSKDSRPEDLLRRVLDRCAIVKEGQVTQHEMNIAFEKLDIEPSKKEVLRVFDHLDRDLADYVSVNTLVKAFYPSSDNVRSDRSGSRDEGSRSPRGGDRDRDSSSSGTTAISTLFRRRTDLLDAVIGSLPGGVHDLDDFLSKCKREDRGRVGELSSPDFSRCMKLAGMFDSDALKRAERDLLDSLSENKGNSGSGINYQDFVDAVRIELEKDMDTDDTIIRLQKRLSRDIKHGHSLDDAFRHFDRNGDGELDIDEVEQAFTKIGIPLSREESRRIVSKFSINGTTIKYKTFLRAMSTDSDGLSRKDVTIHIVDRIQRKMEERVGSKANAARELKDTFADIDTNGNGRVSESEFRKAMNVLKIDIDRDDVSALFKKYDDNGNGEMDYDEFLRVLDFKGDNRDNTSTTSNNGRGGSNNKADVRDVRDVVDTVRRKIEDYLGGGSRAASRIKDTFEDIDENHNGFVSMREFTSAMRALKADLTTNEVDAVFEEYDSRGRGIDYLEFIRLLGFKSDEQQASSSRRY